MAISPAFSTDVITLDTIQQLLSFNHPLSISIYLSADDEVGLEPEQRRQRLKNLQSQVIKQIKQAKPDREDQKKIIEFFEELKKSDKLWHIGPRGFAIFISPHTSKVYSLPIPVATVAQVSPRFHLKPLIRLYSEPMQFYLLSLHKNNIELFKGDLYSLKKINVPELPQSMEEVVGTETGERHLQFRTGTTGSSSGKRPAIYHGNSSWKDDKHLYLERFLQHANSIVAKYLKDSKQPLLLAGAERMITTFLNVGSYKHILKDVTLKDKVHVISDSELHQRALEVLEPFFAQQEVSKIEHEMETGDDSRFSLNLDEILRQSYQGKVDTLLVAQGKREWGIFHPENLSVTYSPTSTPSTQDLLEVASVETLKNGGHVYVLPSEKIPNQADAAAVFRY